MTRSVTSEPRGLHLDHGGVGLGVPGDVGQRLAQYRAAAAPPVAGATAVSTGPLVRTTGREPEHRDVLPDHAAQLGRAASRRAACCSSKIVERMSRIVTSRSSTALSSRP